MKNVVNKVTHNNFFLQQYLKYQNNLMMGNQHLFKEANVILWKTYYMSGQNSWHF